MYPPTYAYYLISNELPISHGLFNSCSPGATACDLLTALRSPTVDVEDWKTDWDRMNSTCWNCLKNAESIEESVLGNRLIVNLSKMSWSPGLFEDFSRILRFFRSTKNI